MFVMLCMKDLRQAFRAVLEALPIFASKGAHAEEVLRVLLQPSQLQGFEVLAASWEADGRADVYQAGPRRLRARTCKANSMHV